MMFGTHTRKIDMFLNFKLPTLHPVTLVVCESKSDKALEQLRAPSTVRSFEFEEGLYTAPTSIISFPEDGRHPRLQGAYLDSLLEYLQDDFSRGLVLETHSEFIISRLIRRVQEGSLDAEDVAIWHFNLDEQGVLDRQRVGLGSRGKIVGGWPTDLFDHALMDEFPDAYAF